VSPRDPTNLPADQRERCEPFPRAMRRYRPRFRGDIENERAGRAVLVLGLGGQDVPMVVGHGPEGVQTCAATD
jgi:hypothetical protein